MSRPKSRGDGKPTRDDVALLAQTSGPTVGRVLSGRTDIPIAPETRARVIAAAQKLGYSPNPAASALRRGRTEMIAVWMSFQYSRYRSQVADRMRVELDSAGLAMAVTDADAEYYHSGSFARSLRLAVDGIIAFDASASVEAFARDSRWLAPNMPFVSMGGYYSDLRSYVGVDLRAGGGMAADHLVGSGRRKIAYMAPHYSGLVTSGERYIGFRDRASLAGLEPHAIGVEFITPDSVWNAISEFEATHGALDGIFCVNDELAEDVLFAIERSGRKAGREMGVIGFNGTEGIERGPCPLSTIAQPIEAMCRLAVEFLKRQMDDPNEELGQIVLQPTLIARASTGA